MFLASEIIFVRVPSLDVCLRFYMSNSNTEKNDFVTATKLGTTNKFFVAATKNFAAATNVLLIEPNILL